MTEVATEDTKKARGDGLVKVTFADEKSNDHKRVPNGVQSVILNGKAYTIASIPQQVKDQLVAFAFAARSKTYVNNHADDSKNGADVSELIEKVYKDMLDGKLYSVTAEGGAKKAKEYDPSDLIEAVKRARDKMGKPASEAQLAALRNKLVNELSGKDRTAFVLKLQQDPIVGPIYQMIKASKKLKAAETSENNKPSVMEDLF